MDGCGIGGAGLEEYSAPLGSGVQQAMGPDERAWVYDAVATDFGMIADHGTELSESGRLESTFWEGNEHLFSVQTHIGKDDSCAEMSAVTEDGITDVVEVGYLRSVEDQGVLELARVSEDAIIAHDDVLTDVTTATDLAVCADPSGALDDGTWFDHGAWADEDGVTDEGLADGSAEDGGFQTELQVARDLSESVPDEGAGVE